MSETFFKTLVVIAIIVILFYLTFFSISRKNLFEGLENNATSEPPSQNGEAGNSENYASLIKGEVVRLKKDLQIKKYQKDYETAIINLEDLINLSMLKIILNLSNDPVKDVKKLETINILKNAGANLNEIMKFVDKQ